MCDARGTTRRPRLDLPVDQEDVSNRTTRLSVLVRQSSSGLLALIAALSSNRCETQLLYTLVVSACFLNGHSSHQINFFVASLQALRVRIDACSDYFGEVSRRRSASISRSASVLQSRSVSMNLADSPAEGSQLFPSHSEKR